PFAGAVLVVLNSVAVLGELYYRRVSSGAVSAKLSTDSAVYQRAGLIFAVASIALWLGGLAGTVGVKRRELFHPASVDQLMTVVSRWRVLPTLIISSIPLVLGVAGTSVGGIFSRADYLETYVPTVLV